MSFCTISSTDSTADTDYSCDTPLTTPSLSTHDTSRASYHINDIASFAEGLQDAANKAFPNRGRSRYQTVNVCLIRWAEDELQVKEELDRLHDVFSLIYGFNTNIWLIPSTASQIQLTSMTCNFLQKFDAEDNLFIVYYGGHGKINSARQTQWWCRADYNSPIVDWSAIQTLFGTARSDVLVLLDCCAAASSVPATGSGVMEAIAACGFESRAPAPGQHSFTNTLVEVLEEWASKPSFSVAMLHTEVLFILKQKRPERGRDGKRLEWCTTPIHWVTTANSKASGIEICPLRSSDAFVVPRNLEKPTSYVDATDAMEIDGDKLHNPLMASRSDGSYKIPHVLISVALEEDQGNLDAASCRRWLADFPALVKYATVEGVYRGYSTLMTLSVPVMVWDMLPDLPGCSFIGYVVSRNMYNQAPPTDACSVIDSIKEPNVSSKRRGYHSRREHSIGIDSSYGSDEDDEHHKRLATGISQAYLNGGKESLETYEVALETGGEDFDEGPAAITDPKVLLSAIQSGLEPARPVKIIGSPTISEADTCAGSRERGGVPSKSSRGQRTAGCPAQDVLHAWSLSEGPPDEESDTLILPSSCLF